MKNQISSVSSLVVIWSQVIHNTKYPILLKSDIIGRRYIKSISLNNQR